MSTDTASTTPAGPAAPRSRLLVVDDVTVNIELLFRIFREDHDVIFATSGEQALELCTRQIPDLILLDVQMPGIDGLETCRRLKANPLTADIPVIFVSGRDDAAEIARGLEAGAVDFVTKPVDRLVVRARVRTHLQLRADARRRRTEDRLQQMVEWAPNALIMVDADGLITLANAQAEKLFGYTRDELVGGSIERLVPAAIRARHPQLRQAYVADPRTRPMGVGRDLYGMTRDGRQVPIEIGLSSFHATEGTTDRAFVLASIVDITERKLAEEARDQLNRSLQAQIAETQRALEQLRLAQDQLIQSEKMASLGGLVAGVAHEINTPVGVGVTAASHLREEVRAMRTAANANTLSRNQFDAFLSGFEQASDILLMNLERAADLVRSFKRVAVDQSSDEQRTIKLRAYLDEVLLSLRPRLKGTPHRIELDCAEDLEIVTTPGALSQILSNLVINSLTHAFDSSKPGLIRVQVRREDQGLCLDYQDDGRGIAAENLPRIFDPFFTTKRGQGGTGLGLNIVFNLVRQTLGGRIEAQSSPGAGARFLIHF